MPLYVGRGGLACTLSRPVAGMGRFYSTFDQHLDLKTGAAGQRRAARPLRLCSWRRPYGGIV